MSFSDYDRRYVLQNLGIADVEDLRTPDEAKERFKIQDPVARQEAIRKELVQAITQDLEQAQQDTPLRKASDTIRMQLEKAKEKLKDILHDGQSSIEPGAFQWFEVPPHCQPALEITAFLDEARPYYMVLNTEKLSGCIIVETLQHGSIPITHLRPGDLVRIRPREGK